MMISAVVMLAWFGLTRPTATPRKVQA